LATVFPDPYEFVVAFEERRNTIEADLLFKRGDDVFTPIESSGGGAIDFASFALRVADWRLRGGRNKIILDEPFRNLSSDLQTKAGELLKRISTELGLQIIMVSHHPKINETADRVFYVNNGTVTCQQ
jgi:DNA repair exonuclease SbcCD ATPase subunit